MVSRIWLNQAFSLSWIHARPSIPRALPWVEIRQAFSLVMPIILTKAKKALRRMSTKPTDIMAKITEWNKN